MLSGALCQAEENSPVRVVKIICAAAAMVSSTELADVADIVGLLLECVGGYLQAVYARTVGASERPVKKGPQTLSEGRELVERPGLCYSFNGQSDFGSVERTFLYAGKNLIDLPSLQLGWLGYSVCRLLSALATVSDPSYL